MDCYECAKTTEAATSVAICPHCGAGLCLAHVREAAAWRRADGSAIACKHDTWRVVAAEQAPAVTPAYAAAG